MDEAVDGAVGRGLQRVVGAVQLENTARARESEAATRWVTAAPRKKKPFKICTDIQFLVELSSQSQNEVQCFISVTQWYTFNGPGGKE